MASSGTAGAVRTVQHTHAPAPEKGQTTRRGSDARATTGPWPGLRRTSLIPRARPGALVSSYALDAAYAGERPAPAPPAPPVPRLRPWRVPRRKLVRRRAATAAPRAAARRSAGSDGSRRRRSWCAAATCGARAPASARFIDAVKESRLFVVTLERLDLLGLASRLSDMAIPSANPASAPDRRQWRDRAAHPPSPGWARRPVATGRHGSLDRWDPLGHWPPRPFLWRSVAPRRRDRWIQLHCHRSLGTESRDGQ